MAPDVGSRSSRHSDDDDDDDEMDDADAVAVAVAVTVGSSQLDSPVSAL
jgi:hypothetical protein